MSSSLLGEHSIYDVEENLSIDFNDFTNANDLDSGPVTTFGRDHKDKGIGFTKDGSTPNSKFSFGLNNDLLAIFVKKTEQNRNEGQNLWSSTEHENLSEETPATVEKVTTSTSTTRAPIRKTSTISLKDYTKARVNFDDEFDEAVNEHTTRAFDAAGASDSHNGRQVGSREDHSSPYHSFGFTSGHQNSFGVPIEEDERLLRMLNEQLMKLEKQREVIYCFNYVYVSSSFSRAAAVMGSREHASSSPHFSLQGNFARHSGSVRIREFLLFSDSLIKFL